MVSEGMGLYGDKSLIQQMFVRLAGIKNTFLSIRDKPPSYHHIKIHSSLIGYDIYAHDINALARRVIGFNNLLGMSWH